MTIMATDDRRMYAFFDPEASGLGPTAFPTEIGWAILTGDGGVQTGSARRDKT